MSNDIEDLLTKGLALGYGGKGEINKVTRGGVFEGSESHQEIDGGVYHDEWFNGVNSGGGQETIQTVEGRQYLRSYCGGTPKKEFLSSLGITTKEISHYLISKILELGDQTRLFAECRPQPDGNWQYLYQILSTDPNIEGVSAEECIYYKGIRVHWHPFILAPIE